MSNSENFTISYTENRYKVSTRTGSTIYEAAYTNITSNGELILSGINGLVVAFAPRVWIYCEMLPSVNSTSTIPGGNFTVTDGSTVLGVTNT